MLRNPYNMGKRKGINHAVRESRAEIIVSVDSDVIVYPTALRELVARFTAPDIAAVGGRVHVSNPNDNWLTKLQTIKYYFGQEHLKNLERALRSVMCLSGCLTAYRRHVLIELEPILENRNILGVPIKYGEDRFLTHQIVKPATARVMTMDAMCFTKAPTDAARLLQPAAALEALEHRRLHHRPRRTRGSCTRCSACSTCRCCCCCSSIRSSSSTHVDATASSSSSRSFHVVLIALFGDDLLLRAVACARCRRGCACIRSRSCRWPC